MNSTLLNDDLNLAPIELVAVKFPGKQFTGEIIDALNELLDRGTLRIVDVVFASRSDQGVVRMLDLAELDAQSYAALEPLVEDVLGILSEEDVKCMGAVLDNGTSAGLMLFENIWATHFGYASARVSRSSASSDRLEW
jgi:uncharacterized protein DUF6325